MLLDHTHADTLVRFNQWMKGLFGKASPCFSTEPHPEEDGSISINHGMMKLEISKKSIRLVDKSMGANIVVCAGSLSLEETLLHGLTWAIRQKFCNTFIP